MVTVKYPVDSYHNPIFGVVAIPSEKFCSSFFCSVYLLLNCFFQYLRGFMLSDSPLVHMLLFFLFFFFEHSIIQIRAVVCLDM